MWVLIIAGFMAISGYQTERDCKEAAQHQTWYSTTAVMCVPASKDAVVSIGRK